MESSLMPVAKGYLLWTMPSGQQTLLEQATGGQREFRSQDRLWRAETSKGRFEISNQDGWQFQYAKGRLAAVISPTHRILEFEWNKRQLAGVRLKDSAAGGYLLLLHLVYGENERVSGLKLHGQAHKFAFLKDGTADRLSAWAPPAGETARFLYQPETGVLWKTGSGNTEDPAGIEIFKTKFVDPVKNGTLADESASKRRPVNHWLIEDQLGTYSYGTIPDAGAKDKKKLNPADVTVTYRSGLVEKSDYAANRGVVTSTRDGVVRKTYYYRAPAQRYDGILRRIEENGKTVVEYRYDRKSGLLTETVDAAGVSTFFDYDPAFKPKKGDEWDPKPLRVRRGTRRKAEIIAEYRYHKDGRVAAVKDGHQQYCAKAPCRKASKAARQARWLAKPENQNYFRGNSNCERVRQWRLANPGYSRRKTASRPVALQDVSNPQPVENKSSVPSCTTSPLQDVLLLQPALLVGLISVMTGHALQDDIAESARCCRGRSLLIAMRLNSRRS